MFLFIIHLKSHCTAQKRKVASFDDMIQREKEKKGVASLADFTFDVL
jgi:hypothetical protein